MRGRWLAQKHAVCARKVGNLILICLKKGVKGVYYEINYAPSWRKQPCHQSHVIRALLRQGMIIFSKFSRHHLLQFSSFSIAKEHRIPMRNTSSSSFSRRVL